MNNEPVAWMDEETGCFVYSQYDYEDLDEHGKDGLIPLYTHPVKELTDEQMISIYEKNWSGIKCGLGRAVEKALLKKAQK